MLRHFALITLALASLTAVAQEPGSAQLRLDPALLINAIDGDAKRATTVYMPLLDRKATLTPGKHTLTVCYDNSKVGAAGNVMIYSGGPCAADREISLDAVAGRIYRLKLQLLSGDWKTWIEDVTEEEAGLPSVEESARRKHKGEGKSTILMRYSPADGLVILAHGSVEQVWFMPGMLGGMPMRGDSAEGFVSRQVKGGATIATTSASPPRKFSLLDNRAVLFCGDTKIPVFEDVPGDGAFYLGEFTRTQDPGEEAVLTITQEGLESARAFLATQQPDLAPKLQLAPLRWLRVTQLCPIEPQLRMRVVPPKG